MSTESFAQQIDQTCINTIRTLSMDAIQAANSGHPGAPMGLAPVAYTLWQRHLRYDPHHPLWPNRDRFVLSAGHASMLLYSLIHLGGIRNALARYPEPDRLAVTLEDIQRFRQLHSPCAGHPELGLATGVETTTGPLGQGAANSVGMSVAGRWLAARYNRPGLTLFDYDVYAILGDGCMQEGIASEAASLAGHLQLENLCWIYDNNRITIEGATELTFSEDVAARFQGYGWDVLRVGDANDTELLGKALDTFKSTHGRPTLIIVDSHIAYGSPSKQDNANAHGAPLGEEEIRLTKKFYGWPEDAQFLVPEGVREHFAEHFAKRGIEGREAWVRTLDEYQIQHPERFAQLKRIESGDLPEGWDEALPTFEPDPKGVATRAASGKAINAVAPRIPWLLGGSADLGPSNKTWLAQKDAGVLGPTEPGGRNIHFGVREHAMGAVANGMALCGLRPYDATFLVFSDYMRPAIRLSAMMELPVVHVFTHDSIGVGEDGPTHQPVEHLASLRAIPGLYVLRPCDANETAAAWRFALQQTDRPTALVLSRQKLPVLDRSRYAPPQVERGAYVLADCEGLPELLLIATGSEVALCLEAWEKLIADGVKARVISMVSWALFEAQPEPYRDEVLPPDVKARVCVEQASKFGWERYAECGGAILAMETFGASAPLPRLLTHFGFTVDHVLEAARAQLQKTIC